MPSTTKQGKKKREEEEETPQTAARAARAVRRGNSRSDSTARKGKGGKGGKFDQHTPEEIKNLKGKLDATGLITPVAPLEQGQEVFRMIEKEPERVIKYAIQF